MTTPLVVPVELDALVANKGVIARDAFRQWQFNYQALPHYKSPEPEAFDRSTTGQKPGVYLHWSLPSALRHGTGAGGDGYPLVPNRWLLVRFNGAPARRVTAWVIESDCPFSTKVSSTGVELTSLYLADPAVIQAWKVSSDPYRNSVQLDPAAQAPQIANLGIRFPLPGWTERAAQPMFLTAVAPANPAFSIYVPHNQGVFAFYDDLTGIDQDTLSYLVVGWYSDPQRDFLAGWPRDTASQHPYDDFLAGQPWTVTGGSETQATTSLYEGMALAIDWDRNGDPPAADPLQAIRNSGQLNVAIGNTTIDAFSALVGAQLAAKGHDPGTVKLLRALQYNLLPVLDQVNGDALLDEAIRNAWFGGTPGGYRWTTVPAASNGTPPPAADVDSEPWVVPLNNAQAALDAALGDLYTLQWRLGELWLKNGFLGDPANTFPKPPAGVTNLADFKTKLAAQLDPGGTGVAAQVVRQIKLVQSLLGQVPQPITAGGGTAQDAFQRGVLAFAQAKGLDVSRVLKAVASPRYYQAANPVVVLSGVEPPSWASAGDPVQVRLASHLVTGFSYGGRTVDRTTVGAAIPALPGLAALPAAISALIDELFFLDPASAPAIASAIGQPVTGVSAAIRAHDPAQYLGALPDLPLGPWAQPWSPMYMDWKVDYTNIPYGPSWVFDGTDYHFDPAATPATDDRPIGGVSLLSSSAQLVFRARLADFIDKFGQGSALDELDQWIEQIDDWKFLAQELVGFHSLISLRDTRAYRRPIASDLLGTGAASAAAADLIGYGGGGGPYALPAAFQGRVDSTPYFPNGPAIPYPGARHGQIYFTDLLLYDKFGRALFVVQSNSSSGLFDAKNFPVLQGEALAASHKVHTEINAVSELPPRVLQQARLGFDLVDGFDDTKLLGAAAGVNPISGWVLPNHLDRSLLLYAPDGRSLGEFRLIAQDDRSKAGEWQAPPHSGVASLDDVARYAPHVAELLRAPALQAEASFLTFLQTIDESLWTIDPLGARVDQNLSVLIGRPLALVRARLQLQLEGQPLGDTGWASTFARPVSALTGYDFAVRLGDQATRQDGVIGYYAERDYSVFNSVVAPDSTAAQPYVREIGPIGPGGGQNYPKLRFDGTTAAMVTLLVDPRASIHATTGILPVKQVAIPSQFVTAALARIEIGFRIGPILTLIEATPSQGGVVPAFPQAIGYPSPAEQNGTWSWWERDAAADAWVGYDLLDTTTNAQLKSAPNTLREGVLQLVLGLGDGQASPPRAVSAPPRSPASHLVAFAAPPASADHGSAAPTLTGDIQIMSHAPMPASPQDDPALLTYLSSSSPSLIQISTAQTQVTALLDIAVTTPPGKAVYCNQIVVAVPIGTDVDDLYTVTPTAAANTAKWTITSTVVRSGAELGLVDDTDYATFTFQTRDPSDNQITYNLAFSIEGQVNQTTGDFQVLIQETSGASSDPGKFTSKQVTLSLTKYSPQFYLQNLVATAPATPTVPATEFSNGQPIVFSWESNGTYFQLYLKNQTAPVYAGTGTTYTLTGGVATDSTFFLVASMMGGSAPDPGSGGYEPIYLYDAITITITNPALTPSSAAISGNASVTGTLGVTGATTLGNASVTGTLGVSGPASMSAINVSGALGVSGTSSLANTSINGTLGVSGTASLGSGSIAGTLGVSGATTLNGGFYAMAGVFGALNTARGVNPGSYQASTDGIVVGVVRFPPNDSGHLCVTWIWGSNSDGVSVMATGGNVGGFDSSWNKWQFSNGQTFAFPVRRGTTWSVSVSNGDKNQVNAPTAFYFIPLGTPPSGEAFTRIGDPPPAPAVSGVQRTTRKSEEPLVKLVDVIEVLLDRPLDRDMRQRLLDILKETQLEEVITTKYGGY